MTTCWYQTSLESWCARSARAWWILTASASSMPVCRSSLTSTYEGIMLQSAAGVLPAQELRYGSSVGITKVSSRPANCKWSMQACNAYASRSRCMRQIREIPPATLVTIQVACSGNIINRRFISCDAAAYAELILAKLTRGFASEVQNCRCLHLTNPTKHQAE